MSVLSSVRRVLVFVLLAACSGSDQAATDASVSDAAGDAGRVDAPVLDASPDAAVADAAVVDAAVADAAVVDAAVVDAAIDAATDARSIDAMPDAPPVTCACDTTNGCQAGCACDPGCAPLQCAPLLASFAYFERRGGGLYGVSMADPSNGWTVGDYGMIMRLSSSGPALVPSPTTGRLGSVEVTDIDTGWAVGQEILRLENGVWRRWTDYTPPAPLNDLDLVDDANGWACGQDGTVARLRDGVWSTVDIGATGTVTGVALVDRDNGRFFGDRRYELRDGAWSSTPQVTFERILDAALVDRDNGWGVGLQNNPIQRLAGGSWMPTNITFGSTAGHATAIVLDDINNGWAMSFSAVRKLVGGVWGPFSCLGSCSYTAEMDLKAGRGWAVGFYDTPYRNPILVPLDTASNNWGKLQFPGGTLESLVAIDVLDESVGWAVGTNGTFVRLTPSGWQTPQSLGTMVAFRGLDLASSTFGWAVGADGRIARFNGTWSLLMSSPTTASLYGVAIAADNTAWAVGGAASGRPGTILRHSAATWTVDPFIPSAEIYGLALTDAANGWAVGGSAAGGTGVILQLEGGVWSEALTTTDGPLWSVALDASGNGWAVGGTLDTGTGSVPSIWRLVGGSWSRVPFTANSMLHGVAIDRDGLGWIVGTRSTVIAIDGTGVSRCPSAMAWPVDLSDVALTPAGRAWVVGTDGMRARTP